MKEPSYHSHHEVDLHQVKWYDGLGHGDLENGLVSGSSGTQVGKSQVCPWNGGFFVQHLGLQKVKAPNCDCIQLRD